MFFCHNFFFYPQHYLGLKLYFALSLGTFLKFSRSHTLKINPTILRKSSNEDTCGKDSSVSLAALRLCKFLVNCYGCAMTYYQAYRASAPWLIVFQRKARKTARGPLTVYKTSAYFNRMWAVLLLVASSFQGFRFRPYRHTSSTQWIHYTATA